VDSAISVVVVTDGAVEQVILEKAIEGFALRGGRCGGLRINPHPVCDHGRAGPKQLSVDFDHARIARLDRAKLRVVAHLCQLDSQAIDDINEAFAGLCH
jgi:hypothetical protein